MVLGEVLTEADFKWPFQTPCPPAPSPSPPQVTRPGPRPFQMRSRLNFERVEASGYGCGGGRKPDQPAVRKHVRPRRSLNSTARRVEHVAAQHWVPVNRTSGRTPCELRARRRVSDQRPVRKPGPRAGARHGTVLRYTGLPHSAWPCRAQSDSCLDRPGRERRAPCLITPQRPDRRRQPASTLSPGHPGTHQSGKVV